MEKSREEIVKKLVNMQYTRNEMDFKRGTFRAKGDILEIYPSDQNEKAIRVEFFRRRNRKNNRNKSINRKTYRAKTACYDISKFSLCNRKRQNGKSTYNN